MSLNSDNNNKEISRVFSLHWGLSSAGAATMLFVQGAGLCKRTALPRMVTRTLGHVSVVTGGI